MQDLVQEQHSTEEHALPEAEPTGYDAVLEVKKLSLEEIQERRLEAAAEAQQRKLELLLGEPPREHAPAQQAPPASPGTSDLVFELCTPAPPSQVADATTTPATAESSPERTKTTK